MNEAKLLSQQYYLNTDVVALAKDLLGKHLEVWSDGIRTSGIIVETEAYRAPDDRACHAHLNKFTKRTKTMFEQGGTAYIYLCYGIHHLFNIVTAPEGMAHAVLIRATSPIDGLETQLLRRKTPKRKYDLSNGPGKVSQALAITKQYNGTTIFREDDTIQIWDHGTIVQPDKILAGPRVGIAYAQESCNLPWRFRLKDNPWTSKPNNVFYTDWPALDAYGNPI